MQAILNDQNISAFLDKIPQKQKIITLKELIYIGIKIVTNSFEGNKQNDQVNQKNYQSRTNNQYLYQQNVSERNHHKSSYELGKEQAQNSKRNKNNYKHTRNNKSQKNDHQNQYFQTKGKNQNIKVQSTLLRQISKIRMQLQNLTNKVYDHCFEQNNNIQQSFNGHNNQSIQFIAANESYIQQHGFKGQNIPTFSPPKNNFINPFAKQKNNFFPTEPGKQINHSFRKASQQPKQQRNRSRSNVMHLDDTQVRQALYKKQNQQQFYQDKNISQKARSVIEKRKQLKKKSQQKYFYDLAIDKKRVDQLNKIKKSKSQIQPNYEIDNQQLKLNTQNNPYRKKAKSKIKKLVQRDRLKYQQKMAQYNFQKGFEQYQYSANQLSQQQGMNQYQQNEESRRGSNQQYNKNIQKLQHNNVQFNTSGNRPSRVNNFSYGQSPQIPQQESSNANFGFYDSRQQQNRQNINQNTFSNNNQAFNSQEQEQDDINIGSNSSSFSEFSMSGSSKRQVGKISRKRFQ